MPRRSALRITKRTVDAITVGEKDTVFWECARLTGVSAAGESPAGGKG